MIDPIPVTLESAGVKLPGFILKINPTGFLVEIDKLPFRVGSMVKAEFQLPEFHEIIIEETRAIKSYDGFFRNPPKTNAPKAGPEAPQPKKLVELHFLKVKETTRQAIMRLLMSLQVESMKKSK